MNKTILTLLLVLMTSPCYAQELANTWYLGLSFGVNRPIQEEKYSSGPTQLLDNKYGLLSGYRFNRWLSLEAGYTQHETKTERFCDHSNTFSASNCAFWKRNYHYSFVGARGSLRVAKDRLAISWRLARLIGAYESNIDNKSFEQWYPSMGVSWLMTEELTFTLEAELIEYPLGNNQDRNLVEYNLILALEL